ncbi:hypothetical protein PPSIR1_33234 [Plesiocystis pacifica SIR-1]|uniref:3-ketosteroid-9-alpha-monooxygenase oxygenase component-like C-terminal domain-containing protein n=1 Tax=Plesiocystis pacifica SIR-1 TaxID=391625 RepID=A6G6K3_9BACT|nr:hypothetical protein [Plesiocystis pacifica]EDM78480.1 hypothetical protein PPSIR1_33234 [Plesiocystis pacifica SIR-1]
MTITPSWYFIGLARDARVGAAPRQSVVADRLLTLRRGQDGEARAELAGVSLPVCEYGPTLLAWLGGGEPRFSVPSFSCAGWLPMRWFHVDLHTRPELVMRDLADIEHFETVHGYAQIEVEQALAYEGSACTMKMAFGWDVGFAGLYIPSRLRSRVDGLGVQRTEVESLGGRLTSRHLVMPTPRLGGVTRVHAGYSVRLTDEGPLARAEAEVLLRYLGRSYRRDLERDAQLWRGESSHRPTRRQAMDDYQRWVDSLGQASAQARAS